MHPFDAYCRFPLFLTSLPLRTSRHPQVFHTSNPSRSSTWILQYRHLPPNSFIAIKSNKSSSEPSSSLSNRLIVRRVSSLSIVCRRLSSSVVVSSVVVSSVVVCRRLSSSLVVGRWSLLVVAPIQRCVLESGEIAAPKIWGRSGFMSRQALFLPLLPNPLPSPNPPTL